MSVLNREQKYAPYLWYWKCLRSFSMILRKTGLRLDLFGPQVWIPVVTDKVANVLTLVSLYFTMRRWYHHPEKKESWHDSDFEDFDHDADKPSSGGGSQPYVVRAMTRMRSRVVAKPQPQPEPETELEEIGD
ncbi:uncharacterized protein LOC126298066 [Schistocerca gregaria]|uniref:uncharacterized protein LOC126298066 n=1 Tax=Schistocerca gregaria TaxID=7010 RepID=UPI00211ECF23|nr:uncharacterized protein LOC126298066 [Schistocerca gregaria]